MTYIGEAKYIDQVDLLGKYMLHINFLCILPLIWQYTSLISLIGCTQVNSALQDNFIDVDLNQFDWT